MEIHVTENFNLYKKKALINNVKELGQYISEFSIEKFNDLFMYLHIGKDLLQRKKFFSIILECVQMIRHFESDRSDNKGTFFLSFDGENLYQYWSFVIYDVIDVSALTKNLLKINFSDKTQLRTLRNRAINQPGEFFSEEGSFIVNLRRKVLSPIELRLTYLGERSVRCEFCFKL